MSKGKPRGSPQTPTNERSYNLTTRSRAPQTFLAQPEASSYWSQEGQDEVPALPLRSWGGCRWIIPPIRLGLQTNRVAGRSQEMMGGKELLLQDAPSRKEGLGLAPSPPTASPVVDFLRSQATHSQHIQLCLALHKKRLFKNILYRTQ